jgi:transketolase
MYAGSNRLENIIATIDYNGQQIDGPVDKILPLLDLRAKWEAFGWTVQEFNGNKIEEVVASLENAKKLTKQGKPVMNLMKTEMGYGVDYMMGSHKWHGVAPNDDELAKALAQIEECMTDY